MQFHTLCRCSTDSHFHPLASPVHRWLESIIDLDLQLFNGRWMKVLTFVMQHLNFIGYARRRQPAALVAETQDAVIG